ncbi:MAG: hypothetical protein QNJ30_00655 [Kiloniellales bacterium]|nr:hypothetical protein [Kiloniellales bacterium]
MLKTCASALLFLTVTLGAAAAQDTKPPSVDEVMSRLGYSEKDRQALKSGKIVTTDVKRTRDDQLIAAAAVFLPVPVKTLTDDTRKGRGFDQDQGILAYGALSPATEPAEWQAIGFAPSEGAEARKLLGYRGGKDFNLSAEEIETLRTKLRDLDADSQDMVETVSAAYREILVGRFEAYQKGGLGGIAPYRSGNATLEPAKELKDISEQARNFLESYFPDFAADFFGFPETKNAEITHNFFWLKRNVEGRPALTLMHDMVAGNEDYTLLTSREYFVGHTYQSLQVIAVALPVEGGSAVFFVNSAFTDQITGFFSGVAQSVGQKRMKSDLTEFFRAIKEERQ